MFEKYDNLIKERAWNYAKAYNLEFQDLYSQGLLVYSEALETHRAELGAFSTHLYNRLATLRDYAKTQIRQSQCFNREYLEPDQIIQDETPSPIQNIFYREFRENLPEDALQVLDYLTSHEWQKPGSTKTPKKHSWCLYAKEKYQLSQKAAREAWETLQEAFQSYARA